MEAYCQSSRKIREISLAHGCTGSFRKVLLRISHSMAYLRFQNISVPIAPESPALVASCHRLWTLSPDPASDLPAKQATSAYIEHSCTSNQRAYQKKTVYRPKHPICPYSNLHTVATAEHVYHWVIITNKNLAGGCQLSASVVLYMFWLLYWLERNIYCKERCKSCFSTSYRQGHLDVPMQLEVETSQVKQQDTDFP